MARLIERLRRQPIEAWVTAVVVVGSALFVLSQLHPALLLSDTTAAGGDMGAHVWGPAYLREELLPRLRWSGWAPDWYAGFPAYHFYMVVPSLLIVLLDVVFFLPYNVAFKLVSVSGLVALPVAAWGMGRLARLPFPTPAALAVATVPFVFDRSFTIYGGNAASTLAGEFAFSISLAFAVLLVGVVLRGLETGRHRAAAAVLLALTTLCHLIPAIFALVAAAVAYTTSVERQRRPGTGTDSGEATAATAAEAAGGLRERLRAFAHDPAQRGNRLRGLWALSIVIAGGLLTSFWTVPFLLRRPYLNDMGWEKLTTYWELLLPGRIGESVTSVLGGAATAIPGDLTWVITLAVVGAGTSIFFRRRFGIFLLVLGLVMAVAVVLVPQGRLWNARLLPFWYLCLYFLAALAVVELISAIAVLVSKVPERPNRGVVLVGPAVATLLVLIAVALPLRALPFGTTSEEGARYSWVGISTTDRSFIKDWARWNYSGYERKSAYPEYEAIVSTMGDLGESRGCGRAMWEYEKELDRFGTPMALMLLPYWTDGCIGSMEGLYFEASATTPYHFLNQSELSAAPSRAQRDLPYSDLDLELGVDHLQLLGVRYYLAFSDAALAQAEEEEDLTLLTTVEGWRVYEVAHTELVQPLANEPAVVRGVPEGGEGWLEMATHWYMDRGRWPVMLAADGPQAWQRVREGDVPVERPLGPTTITDIETDADGISFRVGRPGAPVLVKASYFPNWKASGAEGPYRVAPNLMVVVPTDNFVELHYGRTPVDWLGIAMTLAGIALTVVLARQGRLPIPPRRFVPRPPRPQPEPSAAAAEEEVLTTVGGGAATDPWARPPGEARARE